MTALTQYQRLECTGLWRLTATAQLREVVVGLRDTTLVLADPRTEMALSHWSLPSVERVNPGEMPALFTPGRMDDGSPSETVELDDPDMIAALETVRTTLIRRRPKPGRVRGVTVLAGLAAVALFVFLWLPEAMIRHTASVLPMATRVQIGKLALADAARLTGTPCVQPVGLRGAAALAQRLATQGVGEIDVVRDGVDGAVALPGGIVLLSDKLVEAAQDPEPVAGYALAAMLRVQVSDPVIPILHHAGLTATLRLLTTGHLPPGALQGYAETLLNAKPAPVDEERLLEKFRQVNLSSTAYARVVDPTGVASKGLIDGDPFKGVSPAPVLDDNDWISLQGICAG
ncbi:hypothetical protein GC209_02270 [bacterium]|nr:hypothetical protein [bacterium]